MFDVRGRKVEEINFLASAKFVTFTRQIPQSMGKPQEDGRTVVPAGTVYPANDATAIGILFNDVDVTNGDQPGPVMVEGWVLEERLPEVVTDEAKKAMVKIGFKGKPSPLSGETV